MGKDLLALVTGRIVVVDLGGLRLRRVKRRTWGHDALPSVVDSPEACDSKRLTVGSVACPPDVAIGWLGVLQALVVVVDSRRPGDSPAFRFPVLGGSNCGRLSCSVECLPETGKYHEVGVKPNGEEHTDDETLLPLPVPEPSRWSDWFS